MSPGPQGTISAVFFCGNSKMKSRHTEKACIMIKKRLKLEADGNFYHREPYLVARKPPSSLVRVVVMSGLWVTQLRQSEIVFHVHFESIFDHDTWFSLFLEFVFEFPAKKCIRYSAVRSR